MEERETGKKRPFVTDLDTGNKKGIAGSVEPDWPRHEFRELTFVIRDVGCSFRRNVRKEEDGTLRMKSESGIAVTQTAV
jgi:hypothetical protein